MKSNRKNICGYGVTLLLGLTGLLLQRRMLRVGVDEKGLLIPGEPSAIALWGLSIGFLLLALLLSRGQAPASGFGELFPICRLRGTLGILGGVLVGLYGIQTLLAGQLPVGLLALLAGLSMGFTGFCRFQGKHPSPMFHCVVCIFYVVRLVLSFRQWSADPQLQDYVMQLLACISLMLFSFHRASCDAGDRNPKRTAFFGLCSLFFCINALAGQELTGMLLGSGLWCVGAGSTLDRANCEA